MTLQPNADGNSLPPPPGDPWTSRPRPYPAPATYLPPDSTGRNGFAITGLVLGILPVFGGLLGIIFGLIGRSQAKRSGQKGRVMGTWGAALGAAWLVLIIAVVASDAADEADRDSAGKVVDPGTASAFELRVGDCLRGIPKDGAPVSEVDLVECTAMHRSEVYAISPVDDEEYPGDTVLSTRAEKLCTDAFEPFVGSDYQKSKLDVFFIYPTAQSWEQDDRDVTCLVVSKQTTGSARGSRR